MSDAATLPPVERVVLTFPIPLSELDKNEHDAHWAARTKVWKQALRDAHYEILGQLQAPGLRDWEALKDPVQIEAIWRYPQGQRRPDYDNAVARMSPIFDALETAQVLKDDHQIENVDITFEPVAVGDAGLEIEILNTSSEGSR